MVQFGTEKPVSVKKAADMFGVSTRTISAWFDRGLEYAWMGGRIFTTVEALNRFKVPGEQKRAVPPSAEVRRHAAAMRELSRRHRITGTEALSCASSTV